MKRANCAASAVATKKAKAVNAELKALETIKRCLVEANLPPAVAALLSDTLPDVLLPIQSERHAYQEKIIDLIAAELSKMEVLMQETIESSAKTLTAAEEEKAAKVEVVANAEAALQTKTQVCGAKKIDLADATIAFNKATEALSIVKREEETGRHEVKAATTKKNAVHMIGESVETIHSDPDRISGLVKQIVKYVNIEDAMLVSLPNALSKEASARQGFDQMVMDQLKLKVASRLAELDETINNSGPILESLEKKTLESSAAVTAAREQMMSCAKVFSAAQAEQNEAEAALKSLQKERSQVMKECNSAKRAREDALAQLDLFRDGPLSSFNELRGRTVAQTEDQPAHAEKIASIESETPASPAVGVGGA